MTPYQQRLNHNLATGKLSPFAYALWSMLDRYDIRSQNAFLNAPYELQLYSESNTVALLNKNTKQILETLAYDLS